MPFLTRAFFISSLACGSGFSAPRGTCAGNLADALRLAMCGYGRHRWVVFVNSCIYFFAAKYFFKAARSRRPGDHVVRPAVTRAFRRENLLERKSQAVKLYLCSAVHLSHSRTGCTQQKKRCMSMKINSN